MCSPRFKITRKKRYFQGMVLLSLMPFVYVIIWTKRSQIVARVQLVQFHGQLSQMICHHLATFNWVYMNNILYRKYSNNMLDLKIEIEEAIVTINEDTLKPWSEKNRKLYNFCIERRWVFWTITSLWKRILYSPKHASTSSK